MALGEFIRKQFIDVIEWLEGGENLVAWRYPMRDQEIQSGAQLTVREGQLAVFVDEGRLADVFGPGRHRLGTATLPLLTNLRHWDKLFASPFKSDVVFLSTRQPVALRDRDFGAVRVRAHGNFAWRVGDAAAFLREVLGTRAQLPADEVDEPLRALLVQHLGDAVAESGRPFLDLAANQVEFAAQLLAACRADAARLGLVLEAVTVQSVSLPEELQKLLDQRIGMAMVGPDMGRFVQYQTGQALPTLAAGAAAGGGAVGDAMGLGAGVALGQVLAQQLQPGAAAPAGGAKHAELLATLEKLGELHAKGVLTDAEFGAKKAELLARLG